MHHAWHVPCTYHCHFYQWTIISERGRNINRRFLIMRFYHPLVPFSPFGSTLFSAACSNTFSINLFISSSPLILIETHGPRSPLNRKDQFLNTISSSRKKQILRLPLCRMLSLSLQQNFPVYCGETPGICLDEQLLSVPRRTLFHINT